MRITDLTCVLRVAQELVNKGVKENYKFKVNNYMYKVLKKLDSGGVITELCRQKGNKASFRISKLEDIKLYRHPNETFSKRNYNKVIDKLLENDSYSTIIISTNKGLYFKNEAIKLGLGGLVIAKIKLNEATEL